MLGHVCCIHGLGCACHAHWALRAARRSARGCRQKSYLPAQTLVQVLLEVNNLVKDEGRTVVESSAYALSAERTNVGVAMGAGHVFSGFLSMSVIES